MIFSAFRSFAGFRYLAGLSSLLCLTACDDPGRRRETAAAADTSVAAAADPLSCHSGVPDRVAVRPASQTDIPAGTASTKGMVWIAGGSFRMGAGDRQARPDELPLHPVRVDGFWMDETEVTNARFREFVEATGYVTTAERKPDWEALKKQLPPGTPRPPDSVLVASSLVFRAPVRAVSLDDFGQWWAWEKGADWRHPEGPGSSIRGKEDHPVVHVSWDDAQAHLQ